MYPYKIINAKEEHIDLLINIKLLTMIDEDIHKKLTREEKASIKKNISKSVTENYQQYKLLVIKGEIIGVYLVLDYLDGKIIDEIYLYEKYRNKGIGNNVVRDILSENDNLYVWAYKSNKLALDFFDSLGFTIKEDNGRALILKHNKAYIRLIDEMSNIKYGYMDKNGNKNIIIDGNFANNYYLQSPSSIQSTLIGLSFDQVEYQRYLLSKIKVEHRTYLMLYQDSALGMAHAFLLFKDSNKKYYWYENVWYKYRGIHEYKSKKEALNDIRNKFSKTIKDFHDNKLRMYQFEKPRSGINYMKYLSNAMNGKIVRLEK